MKTLYNLLKILQKKQQSKGFNSAIQLWSHTIKKGSSYLIRLRIPTLKDRVFPNQAPALGPRWSSHPQEWLCTWWSLEGDSPQHAGPWGSTKDSQEPLKFCEFWHEIWLSFYLAMD